MASRVWRNARFDALIYVDDDTRIGPEFVGEHMRALSLPEVGAVAGGIDELKSTHSKNRLSGKFNRWTATPHGNFESYEEYYVEHGRGCNFSSCAR